MSEIKEYVETDEDIIKKIMEKERLRQNKKQTRKQICKKIKTEEECKERPDCLFNKTRKCQKKPIIETHKIQNKQKTETDVLGEQTSKPQIIENLLKPVTHNKMEEEEQNKENVGVERLAAENSVITSKTLDKTDIIGCEEQKNGLKEKMDLYRKEYDNKIRECEEILFGEFITKYFNKSREDKLTHRDLLVGLQKYYIEEKQKDINFILGMQEFIQKFSQKTPVGGSNYKRQHIFEALCRLLVFFDYDNGELGVNKKFFKSLESFISGSKNTINNTILKTKVNEGSASGIVDIFFKSKKSKKNEEQWACETISIKKKEETGEKDEYVMIQNKYYDKEKSNISNYDVTRIYTLADRTNKEKHIFDCETKIILMVNNGDAVSTNLLKAKQQYPGLIDNKNGIIGISTLDNWFQKMLYDLYVTGNITNFEDKYEKKDKKQELQLRFHQKFIIECTKKCIENKISKFIWGAVPRSGKSYMIGGLITERLKNGNTNDIVIILGALTETLQQFKDMFEKNVNFSDYTIITPDTKEKEESLNIYLFSQEFLKDKVDITKLNKKIVSSSSTFNGKFKAKYPKLFEKGKIDLYFDEVHKGGSTDISEGIIHSFNNSNIQIDIFIMVTATFAKPTLRYDSVNFVGSGNNMTETIEWSYNDQQNMKSLNDETKKLMMINSRSGIQREILNDVFIFYQTYYGSDYLNALSKEYQKHPELVLITPECIDILSSSNSIVPSTIDIRNVFLNNLRCTACEPSKPIDFYKNPANIFNKLQPVDDLLNFIYRHIYNYFKSTLNYPTDFPHTELWFLPDKHLYGTDSECKTICKSIDEDIDMDEEKISKKGIPNIEPLTRGLSIKICNHEGFRNYNILIVHNTKFTYLGARIDSKNIFDEFKNKDGKERIRLFDFKSKKQTSLAEQIKVFEKETFSAGKSLIVLTGAKLRLGISLPCADIAFNFDDIKSIDNNYQTMFRVLTERTKPELKKYGYYLDFNKDRSIQFIYEYNKIYGEAKKLQTKESLEALQSLLFTFNYNGLNIIKNDTKDELKLYNDLINKLELSEEGYIQFWSKKSNLVSLIKKSLASSGNIKLLQKLKDFISASKVHNKPKVSIVEKDGLAREHLPFIIKTDNKINQEGIEEMNDVEQEQGEEEDEDGNETEDYGELINSIAEELPTIIALLAIFSKEHNYECDTIEECLKQNLNNIDTFEEQCGCANIDNASILDCFLNSPGLINENYKYKKVELKKIINILLEIINSNDSELLRNNLNFIFDNIKKLMTKSDGIIHDMTDKDIEEKIEQYLSVREEEKNKHGEVFTPIALIEEMFDKLPSNVWSNPDLKWLDPANGIGNFPMVAYQKLMKGLERWEPNEKKRSKHIIENMLYMVEINPKNVKIAKKIFGSKANICCADFLKNSEKCFRQFGVDKFDVIIGNPPFNTEVGEKRFGSGRTLWDKFVIKSFTILVENGYLGFIHPQNWRGLGLMHNIWDIIVNKKVLYLHIYDEQSGKKNFDVSQSFDLYVLQNITNNNYKTEIIDENNVQFNIILKNLPFLPNSNIKKILKLITTINNGIDVIYGTQYHTSKSWVRHNKTTEYKYPIANNINSNGIEYLYTNDNTKNFFGMPKVIISVGRYPYPYNDYEGKLGISQGGFAIPITSKKQGDDIVKAINSDDFQDILKSTKWGAFQIDYRMFKYFKPDFYKYFLKDKQATKIQSAIRGHQQRKKTKKIHKSIVKLQAITRGHQQRKKTKKTKKQDIVNKKGGKKKTRKYKNLFNLW